MSQLLIQTYLSDLNRLKVTSGVTTEQVIRPAFRRLLEHWARAENLVFVEELEYATTLDTKVYPDGTILHALRVPHGYWEAKCSATANVRAQVDRKRIKPRAQAYVFNVFGWLAEAARS